MKSYKVLGDHKQKGLIWSEESRKISSKGKWQLILRDEWKPVEGRGPERGNRLPKGLEAEQEAFEGLTGNYPLYDSSPPLSHEIHSHPPSGQFAIFTWMSDRQLKLTKYEIGLLIFSPNLLFPQCLPSQHHHLLSCQASTPWKLSSSFCSHIHIQPPSKIMLDVYWKYPWVLPQPVWLSG